MRFTIYGERCSGTNYLEELMLNNFNIKVTWDYGWKHFFGFHKFNHDERENDTIFIGIVRDPIEWLCSFHNVPHHVPDINKPWANFLCKPFYSINKDKTIDKRDLNFTTNQIYKSIFELRCCKNYYLINEMPKNVKNYILINYEDLRDNTENMLTRIGNKFNLQLKNDKIENIIYYKKEKNKQFDKNKKNACDAKYIEYMKSSLHKAQEGRLGYIL